MTADQAAIMRDLAEVYEDTAATFRELMGYAQAPELRERIIGELDQVGRRVVMVMMAGGDFEDASAAIADLLNSGQGEAIN